MTHSTQCPNCGKLDETYAPECPHCGYTYRYGDLADFGKADYRFKVKLRCTNCGREIHNGFREGHEVRYDRTAIFNGEKIHIDDIHGEKVLGEIDGKQFYFQCQICELDDRFLIVKRTPIEPMGSG